MKKIIGLSLSGLILTMGLFISNVKGEGLMVENGKKVKFDYTLKVNGEVVESSVGKKPLEYVHGQGQIIPGLSAALEGLHVGDEKSVTVAPAQGYGEVNPEAFKEFPKTAFPPDFAPATGMVVELQTPEGQAVPAVISEVKGETVSGNFNHPMAGKTLVFDVKIIAIE